ncbi:MAG: ATP-binding protein [Actinomycetota bacterium]|nr:ATP-binding protein [Actinomycetota bacterium]
MTAPPGGLHRHLTRGPRSVRARLVATYTVVAVILASIGLGLFTVLVHRSLRGSLDASLQARAAPVVAAVGAPGVPDLPTVVGVRAAGAHTIAPRGFDAVTFVLRPGGAVAAEQPGGLPASLFARSRASGPGSGSGSTFLTTSIAEEHYRVLLSAVTRPDGVWVVGVGSDLAAVTNTAGEAIHQLLVAVPAFIVLAALGAWLLSGAALRPVERMRADAETIGERDLGTRISVPGTADELARLARTFNALLDRLRRSVDRQRDLVADAGHELRTPLAVLRTELELADRPDRSREQLADAITHARFEVERLTRLAEDLLFLARADGSARLAQPAEVDVVAILGGATRASRAHADATGVTLSVDAPGELVAWADPDGLRRAVDNLVANALAATPAAGRIVLSARTDGGELAVSVADTGTGFAPGLLSEAFSRFRRADASRSTASGGAGLGLAIVAEIAAAHGGLATAVNNAGGGATVTLHLPLSV